MDITIQELDESNIRDVDQCEGAFVVDSKLRLRVEHGEITYTVVSVPPHEKRYPTAAMDYHAYIRRPDKAIFLARLEGAAAGRVVVRENWNRYGYIEDLVVDAGCRRLGVGRRLLTRAVEWARAKGLPGVMLETQDHNVAACRFYERNGFRLGGFDRYLYRGADLGMDEVALYWYLLF